MSQTMPCPECKTGLVSIVEAQTETTIVKGFQRDEPLETRLRDCMIAACNACEFCYEITKDGLVGYPN